jgi:methionine-rich copper-binding protein CopC
MKWAVLIASFVMAVAMPSIAATPASHMLVGSTPTKDMQSKAGVDRISLSFAETVELLSVTITLPDQSEQEVFQASYQKGADRKKGKAFEFPLVTPITTPGRYTISYLLTSKSVKSLNGFIDFEILGDGALDVPVEE